MGKFGIGKSVIVHTDQSVQIGSATAWIGYDKNGLLDLYLSIAEKKYFIQEPEDHVQELIERKLENKK
jgi:hypothetical protein